MEKTLFEIDPKTLEELKINKFKLDVECEKNGNLYHYYSDQLVEAEYQRDLLKAKIKEVEHSVALKIRYELSGKEIEEGERIIPKQYRELKVTESLIESLVNTNKDVCETREALILAERKVGKLDALVKAFAQRKGELDNLVSLYLGNYFSTPNTQKRSSNGDDYKKEQTKRLNERSKRNNGSKEE